MPGVRIKDRVQAVGTQAHDEALNQREVHVADHFGPQGVALGTIGPALLAEVGAKLPGGALRRSLGQAAAVAGNRS